MNVTDALLEWNAYRTKLCGLGLVARSTLDNQIQIAAGLIVRLGDIKLERLRKSDIELWMGERLQTCAPVTVRGEMNVLRQVVRWAIDEGHLTVAPRFPKLTVANVEASLPGDDAFLWVLANVPPQHAAGLEFMMLTGLSPHELERVQVQDGQGEGGTNRFDLRIGQREDFAVKQPSRKRVVPLNGRTRVLWFEAAAGAIADTLHPFPKVDAMQKAIRRAVDAAALATNRLVGIPAPPADVAAVTPKAMRKWFASKVAGEQPEHVLQRLMGHAPGSPITRRHYIRSSDAEVTAAADGVAIAARTA